MIISTSNSKPGLGAVEHRLHQPPADQPVARLVVRDVAARPPTTARAAERVRQAPDRRHPAEVAPADDELGRRVRSNARRGRRGISAGSCWPSASSVTTASTPVVERPAEAGPQGRALALVRALAHDRRAGRLGPRRPCRRSSRRRRRGPADGPSRPTTTAAIRGPSSKAGIRARMSATAPTIAPPPRPITRSPEPASRREARRPGRRPGMRRSGRQSEPARPGSGGTGTAASTP